MSAPINDIFISYRRDGGAELAQLVYKDLKKRGYRVFMDVRELRSGHFDDELRRQVGAAKDFLLLLTPNSLDRCSDPGDWVRSEIALALQLKLNIVPLVKPPFRIPNPEDLPPELAELPRHNAVEYNHDKSDESLAIAALRLRSKSSWLRAYRGRLLSGSLSLVAVLAALGVWVGFADLGKKAEKTQQTTAEIKNATSNILESTVAVQQDASTIKQGISELADKADKQAGVLGQQLDEISIAIREQIGGGNLGSAYDKVNFHRDYQDEYLNKGGALSSLLSEYAAKAEAEPKNAMYQYLIARLYEKSGRIDEARSFATKGYEADPTFMLNRRMLLYECMPEKIDLDYMLSLEAKHYSMTDSERTPFSSGILKEAITALSNIRERLRNDPFLYEDLSPQKIHSWHLFKLLISEPYSRNDVFSDLIGKTSVSKKGLLELKVLDVKKGVSALDVLSKGKSLKIWDGEANPKGQINRGNFRGLINASESLMFPPVAVLASVKPLFKEVNMRTLNNRRFSLLGDTVHFPKEMAAIYPQLDNFNKLTPAFYDSDNENVEKDQEFWIVFLGLPLSYKKNSEISFSLSFQVEFGYDKDYGSDLIKVSDFVGLSNFDSLNLRNGETDFVSFEKNFRQASVLPRSKLQKNGLRFEVPFNAIISSNDASGATIYAYGLENRKIRLLVDPENIFYGSKMANFVASHPQSEVIKLLDDFKNGDVVHLNGTVIDNENDELLMIPNTLSKHPESLRSTEMTAAQLLEQGDYLGAELLYRRALLVYEKVYGPENHETLGLVNNLAWVLILKSDNAEAEALCRRSLTGFEKLYGPEHPNTLQNINNLSILLNQTERRSAAVKLLQETAALSDQAEDSVRYNLACYECLEGNIDAAKRLISDHLKVHPDIKSQALADSDLAAIREFIETM